MRKTLADREEVRGALQLGKNRLEISKGKNKALGCKTRLGVKSGWGLKYTRQSEPDDAKPGQYEVPDSF